MQVYANDAVAFGWFNTIGSVGSTTTMAPVCIGASNRAMGGASIAIGANNHAEQDYACAIGLSCEALGIASFANWGGAM